MNYVLSGHAAAIALPLQNLTLSACRKQSRGKIGYCEAVPEHPYESASRRVLRGTCRFGFQEGAGKSCLSTD